MSAARKVRKDLCADTLFGLLRSLFSSVPDPRSGQVEIPLDEVLMSAFAMFSLKDPSLLAFDDFEFHLIAFSQALVSLGSDGAVVYKNISSIFTAYKAVSLGIVKPLHCTFQSVHLQSSSVRAVAGAAAINQPG